VLDNNQSQRKTLTPHQRAQAIELHATGMSIRKIACELGCKSDSTIRKLFIPPKKPKPVVAPTLPAKKTKPKTPSVLVHHIITSSTSVPMRRRHYSHPLNYTPTRNELLEILHDAVVNTPRR